METIIRTIFTSQRIFCCVAFCWCCFWCWCVSSFLFCPRPRHFFTRACKSSYHWRTRSTNKINQIIYLSRHIFFTSAIIIGLRFVCIFYKICVNVCVIGDCLMRIYSVRVSLCFKCNFVNIQNDDISQWN